MNLNRSVLRGLSLIEALAGSGEPVGLAEIERQYAKPGAPFFGKPPDPVRRPVPKGSA